MKLEWFVVTRVFREGGRIVAGPFDTEAQATAELMQYETYGLVYLVDSREV